MIMKHRLLLTAFVLLASVAGRADELINEENFPDANFRNWLLSQEYGKDGVLTHDEVLDITEINVMDKGISNMKGIEYFTALKFLYCSDNKLTALDVSENTALVELYCSENQLKELDFSKNKGLLSLRIFNNQIKGSAMDALIASLPTVTNRNMRVIGYEGEQNVITVEQVKAVKAKGWNPLYYTNGSWLECTGAISINETTFPDENFRNWVLSQDYGKDGMLMESEMARVKQIDVSKKGIQEIKGIELFTELMELNCSNNELYVLDLMKNTNLRSLYCSMNRITTLKITRNTMLETLECFDNWLSVLDVSENTKLETLKCQSNYLTSLSVYNNTALKILNCNTNKLTSLDLSKNTALTHILCNENQLTALDLSKNTNLYYMDCSLNQLTSLDLSENTALGRLSCEQNKLTSLDLSKNTALIELYCGKNQLTSIDVSKNTNLDYLNCSKNQLTSIDVSKNANLRILLCHENQLTSLFVSKDGKLYFLSCYQNRIKGAAMDALISALPKVSNPKMYVIYNENEQNEMTDAQVKAAKAKGWTPNYCDVNSEWQPYPGQESIDAIASPLGETEEGAVFDLSGRRVEKPGKGIFIRNGRKVAAK